MEEGVFGWVAMNYAMGTLFGGSSATSGVVAAKGDEEVASGGRGVGHRIERQSVEGGSVTQGTLVLGGSSLEVRSDHQDRGGNEGT